MVLNSSDIDEKLEVRNKPLNKNSLPFPKRSLRYGVGKEIGGAIYVHRRYESVLPIEIDRLKRILPSDFEYTVVKYHAKANTVSFISSPDFDTCDEPAVGDIWTIRTGGTKRFRQRRNDPEIYHHKWLFVRDDYPGFDVDQSKQRSLIWGQIRGIDRRRIGRRQYWETNVVPRIQESVLGSEQKGADRRE